MSPDAPAFMLEAIDEGLLYLCLATRFRTADLQKLKTILSVKDGEDPSLERVYLLSAIETALEPRGAFCRHDDRYAPRRSAEVVRLGWWSDLQP
jgi:hypothetical protein